jgi:hypothetical protein
MLTDEIIDQIYSNELHPKYGKFGKTVLYALAIALANFTIHTLANQEFIQAAIQAIVVIGFICEARSRIGYNPIYIQELVNKLTEINLLIANIKDNRARVEIIKEFNYYIDLIVDRPNSVSKFELNKLLNDIKLQIAEEDEEERQGYNFYTDEEFEEDFEKQRQHEEAFKKRKEENKRKQNEKDRQEEKRKDEDNRKKSYFDKCYSLNELNKRKKDLLKMYHPDNHNNELEKEQCEQISKEINEAFVEAKNALLNDFNI